MDMITKKSGRKEQLLARASQVIPCLRKACYMGKSPQQCMVLLCLFVRDEATIDDLFALMGVDDSSIYARLRYLKNTGDIAVDSSSGCRVYRLTTQGRHLVMTMLCARNAIAAKDRQ